MRDYLTKNHSHLLEGILDSHDKENPPIENSQWADEALHVPYNTLAHYFGAYSKDLWVKFDEIRSFLGLHSVSKSRAASIEDAPLRLKSQLIDFFIDWPNYNKNCFLIMPFRETPVHKGIHTELKSVLEKLGFNLLRADDKNYGDDVLSNIETYIFGCKFAFAVHERVDDDSHNPNVALEVGYFMGQGKNICLLKEKTVKTLPSDLQGKLYVSFDAFNINESISSSIKNWLQDKSLI